MKNFQAAPIQLAPEGARSAGFAAAAGGTQGSDYLHPRGTFGDKTMNDPIVEEVRRVRDAHAAMFNYDLDAIFQDIKEQEKKSGQKFVTYPPRRTEPERKNGSG